MISISTYRIDKSTEVEKNRVKGNDAHGLQRIAINEVGWNDSVPHLNAHGNLRCSVSGERSKALEFYY
jgi:hypothetical protein